MKPLKAVFRKYIDGLEKASRTIHSLQVAARAQILKPEEFRRGETCEYSKQADTSRDPCPREFPSMYNGMDLYLPKVCTCKRESMCTVCAYDSVLRLDYILRSPRNTLVFKANERVVEATAPIVQCSKIGQKIE